MYLFKSARNGNGPAASVHDQGPVTGVVKGIHPSMGPARNEGRQGPPAGLGHAMGDASSLTDHVTNHVTDQEASGQGKVGTPRMYLFKSDAWQ